MQAIDKTHALIEALPYLQAFRGKTFLIKMGGSAMEDPDLVRRVRMACYRVRALGSAAIHFREIASGILDAYLGGRGTPTPLHDLGPGLLLVREAGGRDSDGAGGDPLVSQHVVVAGAPRVHDGLVALLGRDG